MKRKKQLHRWVVYLVAFVGFSALVAAKDVSFRYLLVSGLSVPHLLFTSGLSAVEVALILSLIFDVSLSVKNYRYQAIRFAFDGASWIFAALAFQHLTATSISFLSKAYMPLLILIAPWLGNRFSRLQYGLASLSLISMIVFAFIARDPRESLTGYGYLLLAVISVGAGYIMLRQSTLKESTFVVAVVPALSCVSIGGVWLLFGRESLWVPVSWFSLELVCGVFMYGIYTASIYRYQILPLGLAEYPNLLTTFYILPAEYWIFKWFPSTLYLANSAIILGLLGISVFVKLRPAHQR